MLHCDGAQAYPGVVQDILDESDSPRHIYVDQVSHSDQQWTRFHRHTVSGHPSVTRIRVIAGTQLVESWWDQVQHHAVPEERPANAPLIQEYVDALAHRQWCVGDPVEELGAAWRAYMPTAEAVEPEDVGVGMDEE